MKNKLNIRYIVELVITLLLVLVIAVVLVRFFVLSRNQSVYARDLTHAVNIAQNIAEMSASADSTKEFEEFLEGSSQISIMEKGNGNIELSYVYPADEKGSVPAYRVTVRRTDGESGTGYTLNEAVIEVYTSGSDTPIYSLTGESCGKEALR